MVETANRVEEEMMLNMGHKAAIPTGLFSAISVFPPHCRWSVLCSSPHWTCVLL